MSVRDDLKAALRARQAQHEAGNVPPIKTTAQPAEPVAPPRRGPGRPQELVNPVKVMIKVDAELLGRFDKLCQEKGMSRSKLLRELMRKYLDENLRRLMDECDQAA